MNKNTIKVIKRNKESLIEKTRTASQIYLPSAKVQITNEREMVNAVNSWIDERGANQTDGNDCRIKRDFNLENYYW